MNTPSTLPNDPTSGQLHRNDPSSNNGHDDGHCAVPSPPERADVVVIGGGPGGTTAGALLAERGHKVILLEKARHPRFHLGESLLPSNLRILERLGVLAQVADCSVLKLGADFTCDTLPEAESSKLSNAQGPATTITTPVQTFRFERALGDTPGHAYQVRRSEFDRLLFENCRSKGVEARENATVTQVDSNDDGSHTVTWCDEQNQSRQIDARFLIDASGRDSLMAKKRQWQRKNPRHASAAIFGHFANVPRRPGDDAGNISIYWFDHGWIWMIPLADDIMSIGAVCWPDYLKSRKTDTQTFLRDTIAQSPAAFERIKDAVATNPVRVTGNYSYRSKTMYGKGFLLVGDAYAFVDPVFSSGVYLSMSSAERCIESVQAWLDADQRRYYRLCRQYQRRQDREIKAFSWFIYRFTTPAMRELFRSPRNDLQIEQAVISMLAGNGNGSRGIKLRISLFKLIYHASRLKRLGKSFNAWRRRRTNARLQFEDEHIMTTR